MFLHPKGLQFGCFELGWCGYVTLAIQRLEVNIIAQAFVGFCAKVLSWAHDLSRRKREVLATTVLDSCGSNIDMELSWCHQFRDGYYLRIRYFEKSEKIHLQTEKSLLPSPRPERIGIQSVGRGFCQFLEGLNEPQLQQPFDPSSTSRSMHCLANIWALRFASSATGFKRLKLSLAMERIPWVTSQRPRGSAFSHFSDLL